MSKRSIILAVLAIVLFIAALFSSLIDGKQKPAEDLNEEPEPEPEEDLKEDPEPDKKKFSEPKITPAADGTEGKET